MAALFCYICSLLSKPRVKPQCIRQLSKYKLRLPATPHLVLSSEDIKDCAIFIIGDVHGCLDELEELLQAAKMEVNGKNILPIFVGDLANKGPHNSATIRKIRGLHDYAVRGNHDEAVLKQCLNRQEDPDYVVPNKFKWITELEADDIEYLRELPYTISIPSKKALIVHAGIVPGVPLDEQKLTNFINMRNLDIEDGKYVACIRTFRGEAWASLWPGPDHVYFGHDAMRKLQQYHNATGLDTGCLYGDSLSGILIDSKKIIQVKARKTYRQP